MVFLLLVFLLGGSWETEALSVTGLLGKEVTIKCSHSNAFSNVKYFCSGACGDEDILISSSKSKRDSKGRYSIKDGGNTFSVTISSLTEADSGTYWCGIERYGLDTYNEVVLSVIEEKNPGDDFPQSHRNSSSSKKVVYIGAGIGVVVLALAMVLLIFFRQRQRLITTSSGKDQDKNQDGHHITTSCSTANEDREPASRAGNTFNWSDAEQRDHPDDVDSEPHIHPDGLFYATVSFIKHSDGGSVTALTAPVTYSTIKHSETDQSVVCHNA